MGQSWGVRKQRDTGVCVSVSPGRMQDLLVGCLWEPLGAVGVSGTSPSNTWVRLPGQVAMP